MKTDKLSNHQLELVLARCMGYHARMPRNNNIPYVMIDDWNKPGTVVNGCRFEPMTDDDDAMVISRIMNIQFHQTREGWNAGRLLPGIVLVTYNDAATRNEAIVKCAVKSIFPKNVPDEMLEDNPL